MKSLILIAAALHFVILIASALTPWVLDWRRALSGLHPFLRRLFWVYGAFIVWTIIGFGTLTFRFADQLGAGEPVARGLAGFIALFWGLRLAVQFFVFDPTPFLTNGFLKLGYHGLTLVFIYFTGLYAFIALGRFGQ